jgi:hypothetical protein
MAVSLVKVHNHTSIMFNIVVDMMILTLPQTKCAVRAVAVHCISSRRTRRTHALLTPDTLDVGPAFRNVPLAASRTLRLLPWLARFVVSTRGAMAQTRLAPVQTPACLAPAWPYPLVVLPHAHAWTMLSSTSLPLLIHLGWSANVPLDLNLLITFPSARRKISVVQN